MAQRFVNVTTPARTTAELTFCLDTFAPRTELVEGIYRRLCVFHFLHIRAPPATGKSTLLKLLHNYILSHNPRNLPIWTATAWWRPREELQHFDLQISAFLATYSETHSNSLWRKWLNFHAGVDWDIADHGYWLLIDEAQTTYRDSVFWNDFIKLIGPSSAGYVILFSSYGSPGDNPLAFPTPTTIPHAAVTPIYIPEGQQIGRAHV